MLVTCTKNTILELRHIHKFQVDGCEGIDISHSHPFHYLALELMLLVFMFVGSGISKMDVCCISIKIGTISF